ncbi:hypothetical protein THRCLA_20990 [Thraustotheca clavata]|uniref:Sulfotransferase n=1 Tax=Thraustotheca clavata TaxID=74557 RepID=A0A1W0A1B1_9STRA|nr:hypothetical protein THRCLA_20990 [Thraustotheca clavata]
MNSKEGLFHFQQKHVLSIQNNALIGATVSQWLSILWCYGRYIEWKYIPRAIFITCFSIINTFLGIIESILYPAHFINEVPLPENPVFIIGHPRTGTTYLHNLMATDNTTFYNCSTFCTGFANCFLWFEKWGKILFARAISGSRPMDSMPFSADLPQEDEVATMILSNGMSYYMPYIFMQQETLFRKYFALDPRDGATPEDEAKWIEAFIYLVRKLVLRAELEEPNKPRRLLLKTPLHAARIPILRRLFPKATFVYLHRDPYKVIQSTAHMVNTFHWYCRLNTPTDTQTTEYIFWQFERLWEVYNESAVLNKSQPRQVANDIIELGYNDIVNEPISALQHIYKVAGILWTEDITKRYQAELAILEDYKVNKFVDLPEDIQAVIRTRCKDYFIAFGYPM